MFSSPHSVFSRLKVKESSHYGGVSKFLAVHVFCGFNHSLIVAYYVFLKHYCNLENKLCGLENTSCGIETKVCDMNTTCVTWRKKCVSEDLRGDKDKDKEVVTTVSFNDIYKCQFTINRMLI